MTVSLSLKRAFLNDWLEDTLHYGSSNQDRTSLSTKKRKVSRRKELQDKVDRLSEHNVQLKQCAHALEMQHQSVLDETVSKQTRVALLEEQLALVHKSLLLKYKNTPLLV
ncbi:hypothetical protein BC941DRAFT_514017 [Chlamydoabsidia padenii]|nr:hypothetical protein BC941DRAFT_514017 [Chlamydoabsidia padenii]